MKRWTMGRRVVVWIAAGAWLLAAGCSTIRGLGQDISAASNEMEMVVFGTDPDMPPND